MSMTGDTGQTGAGSLQGVVRTGFADYADTLTASTPLVLSDLVGFVYLTNNILGAATTNQLPTGVGSLWNAATSAFDLSTLNIGDLVTVRVDVTVAIASPATVVNLEMDFGIGGTPFSLPIASSKYFKSAGSYRITELMTFYIGSDNTRLNPAKLKIKADGDATCVVHGWLVKAEVK